MMLKGRGDVGPDLTADRLSILYGAEQLGQGLHALQIVNRQKVIDVRQRCPDSLGERLVSRRPKQRVQPDYPATRSL